VVSCDEYDYIEIACMYRYTVKLTMISGTVIEGVAMDTSRNQYGNECVVIYANKSNSLVELKVISKLEALTENSHFSEIVFGNNTYPDMP